MFGHLALRHCRAKAIGGDFGEHKLCALNSILLSYKLFTKKATHALMKFVHTFQFDEFEFRYGHGGGCLR